MDYILGMIVVFGSAAIIALGIAYMNYVDWKRRRTLTPEQRKAEKKKMHWDMAQW